MLNRLTSLAALALLVWSGPTAELDYEPVGGFTALSVPDVDASSAWYREMLGFEPAGSGADLPSGVRMRNLQRGNYVLELVEHPQAVDMIERVPELEKPYLLHGIWKLGFHVADFDALHEHLGRESAEFYGETVTAASGTRMFIVLDNAGNRIQIFEARAK